MVDFSVSEQITSTEAQKKGAAKPRRQYKCPVCKNPMKGLKMLTLQKTENKTSMCFLN